MFLILFYASEWVIRVVMLLVVTRKRRPVAAMAWLLAIFFEPWVGLVVYLLIGTRRPHDRRFEQHRKLEAFLRTIGEGFQKDPNVWNPPMTEFAAEAAHFVQRVAAMPVLGGNELAMMAESERVVSRLIEDIESARDHVHLLFYIYADDSVGRRVADSLAAAVRRGITCRVIVDAIGSRPMLKTLAPRMREDGILVQDALPVSLSRRFVGRVDLRNHRKIAIIDGRIAYTGSQNIVEPSYGFADLVWCDLMARLTGPVVMQLQAMFVGDWYMESGELLEAPGLFPEPTVTGDILAQVLPSGPIYLHENYQRLVVSLLHRAQRRVCITSPYFIPDEGLTQALEVASLKGVRVDLIVPARSDQILVGAAARGYYQQLLDIGVNVYLFEEGLLHAKTLIVDGTLCCFGTSNFDIRSFALDFEDTVVFYGEEAARILERHVQAYLRHSRLLTFEEWNARPRAARIWENIARLFSPLL